MSIVLRACTQVDRTIAAVARSILVITGSALFVTLLMGVALRYVLTESLPWATELPVVLFPVFIMAGIVLAAQRGQHVALEFLLARLNAAHRRLLLILVNLIVAGAYLVVIDATLRIMPIAASDRTPILGVPGTLTYGALAAGFVLLITLSLTLALRLACDSNPPAERPTGA